jgi:hypothetical protein
MVALRKFEATEANVSKLERLWTEAQRLMPDGRTFGDNADYDERGRELMAVLAVLPKIDGWKPDVVMPDSEDIEKMRLGANEVNEFEYHVSIENELAAPGKAIREYRFKFNRKRRELIREAIEEHMNLIEVDLSSLYDSVVASSISEKVSGPAWESIKEHVDQMDTLLGASVARPRAWNDLRRHLSFGQVQDVLDIKKRDWPQIRKTISDGLYDKNEPIPLDIEDLADIVSAKPRGTITTKLAWEKLDDEMFERLLFRLISEVPGYENPQWLMKTKASDRGRDLSVTRVLADPLSGAIRQRVVIQCKNWLKNSVSIDSISETMQNMALWDEPPVDVLVMATSGRFSSDAVLWVEKRNVGDNRIKIEMWPESHLERLLASRPGLIAEFRLR